MLERVEAEFQFMPVDRPFVDGRTPSEHISVGLGFTVTADVIGGDDGLGTEEPVDAHEVLWRITRIGLAESADIFVRVVAENRQQRFLGLFHRHRTVVRQTLQFVEGRADDDGDVVGNIGKPRLERLLEQGLTIRSRTESPHHGGAGFAGAYAGCHRPLPCGVELLVRHRLNLVDVFLVDTQFF